MLPRLYRCVLHLHPPGFRKRFGDEMLAIFEQSRGKWSCLRLLLDATASLFRQWALRSEFWNEIPAPVQQPTLDGIPSFCSLEPFRPRTVAVVPGLVLSSAVFVLTCVAIKHSWIHVLNVHIPEAQFEAPQWIPPSLSGTPAGSPPKGAVSTNSPSAAFPSSQPLPSAPTQANSLVKSPSSRSSGPAEPTDFKAREIAAANLKGEAVAGQPLVNGAAARASYEESPLDAAARHLVIDGAIANLNKYYVDPDVAQKMSGALRAHEKNGDDNEVKDRAALAELLTTQMRIASHDNHIQMDYRTIDTAQSPAAPSPDDIARFRNEMQRQNCTFERVEILPHNIGYLKLNSFPDSSICGPIAKAAMAKLNHVDAIVFDLRDNPGGYANMVALLATYLFDHPTHLNDFYDRAENSTEESWTLPSIPGNELANKPVFVLTSRTTFSAAEGFSYDLKMLKRATLVGEVTSGRGHMGAEHRIDDHFTILIPGVKVINPISGTNWEGTGVEPDMKVKAHDALKTAIHLAEAEVQRKKQK